jgi:hypothetical protein
MAERAWIRIGSTQLRALSTGDIDSPLLSKKDYNELKSKDWNPITTRDAPLDKSYRLAADNPDDSPSFVEAVVVCYVWSYDYKACTTLEFHVIDHPALENICVLPREIFQEIVRPAHSHRPDILHSILRAAGKIRAKWVTGPAQ